MTHVLAWILATVGAPLCATAGAVMMHYAERRRWRLIAAWRYCDGLRDGRTETLSRFCESGPEVIVTADGRLAPDLEGWQPWADVHQAGAEAMEAIDTQTELARASLGLS